MAHAAAKLSELQNCASTLSNLVLQRDLASSFNRLTNEFATKARWMKKRCFIDATFVMAKRVAGQKSDQRSAEKA